MILHRKAKKRVKEVTTAAATKTSHSDKRLREISKFKVLIYITSESFIPSIPFNGAPVCANVNFQVKFSLQSPLRRLLKTRASPIFSRMKQLGVFLLHPGRGTSQPQGYPQRKFTTAGESRVFVGLEENLILVGNWSTLLYFWVKQTLDFLIHPVQNEKIDGLERQKLRNLGNAVRCEICSYPIQQKSYRDRDFCSFVSTCNG